VLIFPSGNALVRAALHRVQLSNNQDGLYVDSDQNTAQNLIVSITDSIVAYNADNGVFAISAHALVHVMVMHCTLANNTRALTASTVSNGQTFIRTGFSTYSGNINPPSLVGAAAHILSFGDNYSDDIVIFSESVAKN
jgi:6-phosphogluconate dehydrogenase (decarboxylating)